MYLIKPKVARKLLLRFGTKAQLRKSGEFILFQNTFFENLEIKKQMNVPFFITMMMIKLATDGLVT